MVADINKEGTNGTDTPAQPKPGDTIAPAASSQAPPAAQPPATTPTPDAPAKPTPRPSEPKAPSTQPTIDTAPQTPIGKNDSDSSLSPQGDNVSWTASEFVAHEKSIGWYATLALVTAVLVAVIFLLTKDVISSIVVIVGAFVLGVYGARKPRQLEYRLDDRGVGIGQKYHEYEEFRSFAIVPEGAFSSIVFMPLKRFAPVTTIYYAPDDEDKIVDLLADRLPFEEHGLDLVDRFMSRIRF